jgi:hypothetical protein
MVEGDPTQTKELKDGGDQSRSDGRDEFFGRTCAWKNEEGEQPSGQRSDPDVSPFPEELSDALAPHQPPGEVEGGCRKNHGGRRKELEVPREGGCERDIWKDGQREEGEIHDHP